MSFAKCRVCIRYAFILLTLVNLWLPSVVHAAGTGISLTTSPVVLNLSIQPGTSDTRTLQLMNNSAQPLNIHMQLNVFSTKGQNGEAVITQPLAGDESVQWVSFSPTSFVAKPGVWSAVKMTINLPVTATLGYYYAVLFKPEINDQTIRGTTAIRGSNGVLVLVDTHSSDEQHLLEISKFTTDQDVYEYLPTTFTIAIRNGGNIYTAPAGNVYVSQHADMSDTLAALDINPNSGNILPQSSRDFQVQWLDGFPLYEDKKINGQTVRDNHGNIEKQLSWSFAKLSKIRFGQYYAKVTVISSDGKRIVPLSKVLSFWVIPWKLMMVTLLVVGILGIGSITIIRFVLRVTKPSRIYRR